MLENYPLWQGPAGNGITPEQQQSVDAAIAAASDLQEALPEVEAARQQAVAAAETAAPAAAQAVSARDAAQGYAANALGVAATMIPGEIKFGWVTDIHYKSDPAEPAGGRYFNDGVQKVQAAMAAMVARGDVDFVVAGGDLINGFGTNDAADIAAVATAMHDSGLPAYIIGGNHDYPRITFQQFLTSTRMAAGYFHMDMRGVRFIFLDTNYNRDEDDAHYSVTNYVNATYDKFIPPGERAWLSARMAEWPGKFVLFSHHPFWQQTEDGLYLDNADAIHAIMLPYASRVLGVISGHSHRNIQAVRDGIVHYETEAVADELFPNNAYAVVTVDGDDLSIEGYGQMASYQVPDITSPSNLTAVEGYPLRHKLVADQAVEWSIIGGADADSFVLSGTGDTLQFVGLTAPDGTEQTTYAVQVAAELGGVRRTQAITVNLAPVPVWETETNTLVARMAQAPSITQRIAYNNLILALKTGGVWANLVGFKVLAAHSRQAALLDWRNAAYDMPDVTGPTFTANRGMTGDGVNAFTIPFSPRNPGTSLYTQDSALIGLAMTALGGASGGVFGNTNTRLGISATGTLTQGIHNTTTTIASYGMSHVAARRTSASAYQLFKAGVLERTIETASALPTLANFTVLGAGGGFTQGRVAAVYWGSGAMTDNEMAILHNALRAYLSAVGAGDTIIGGAAPVVEPPSAPSFTVNPTASPASVYVGQQVELSLGTVANGTPTGVLMQGATDRTSEISGGIWTPATAGGWTWAVTATGEGGTTSAPVVSGTVNALPTWEAETDTLVARMTTAPSINQRVAYNQLIASLKSSGAWAKLVGFKVLAAHTRQAALLDWKDGAFDMADVVGPTFTANLGMTGDGVNALTIPFNPRTQTNPLYAQDSAVIGLFQNAIAGGSGGVFGNTNARLGINSSGTLTQCLHNTSATISGYGLGHVAARRAASTGYDLFKDGALERSIVAASVLPVSVNFTVLGAGGGFTLGRVAACYWGSGTMTNAEMASIHSALSAYLSSV